MTMLTFPLAVLHNGVAEMTKATLALGGVLQQNGIVQRLVLQNTVALFKAFSVLLGNGQLPSLSAIFLPLKAYHKIMADFFTRRSKGAPIPAISPCPGNNMRCHLDLLDHAKTAFSPKHFLGIGENTDQKANDQTEDASTDLHIKGLHGGHGHDRSKDDQGAKEDHLDHLFAAKLSEKIPNFGIFLDKLLFKFLYGLHKNQLLLAAPISLTLVTRPASP